MKRYFSYWVLYFLLPSFLMAQGRLSETLGDYVSHQNENGNCIIQTTNGKVALVQYAPDVIRVRVAKTSFDKDFSYAVIQKASNLPFEIVDKPESITLSTNKLKIVVQKKPLRLSFQNLAGEVINEDYDWGVTWLGTEVYAYKKMYDDEKFIGLGEKTGNLNRRGSSYQHWNSDVPAYAMNADPLYKTLPFYIGIQGNKTYGVFLDNTHRSYFDFGASTDEQFMRFGAADGELNYYFFGGSSVKELIEDYTWLTGRMKLPPLWSLGYQQCRWSYFPDKELLSVAKTFREKKIPSDVLYLDINYMDAYKIFTFHPEHYPNPKSTFEELKKMGFHIVVIVDPGIKIEKGYKQYEEGIKNDFFVKYPNGKFYTGSVWPGRCHFPDFTSEQVRNWWGKQFQVYVDAGIEGFWNDMNEPAAWGQNIPNIIQFQYDGKLTTLNEARNVYGLQMSRATKEGATALMGNKRNFVLTRAAYAGIQRYSAVWTGDNVSNEDHLILGTRLVSSLGLTGIAFAGPDVGGFIGEPSKELFLRWLSLGTFTPFFRNHSEINSKDQEPWTFGEWAEDVARNQINLRYRLLPYIYSTFHEATQTGMPVARSLAIDYTFDNKVYDWGFQNEYLFGSAFLVAPVTSKERYTKVYFPKGTWYDFYSLKKYEGNTSAIIEAPIEQLPVFVKAGSIIPLQSVVQHTQEQANDTLTLRVYFDEGTSTFMYYEDDGSTYDYEKGAYYQRNIVFNGKDNTLILEKPTGNYTSKFNHCKISFNGFPTLKKATISTQKTTISQEKPQIIVPFDKQEIKIQLSE